MASKVAKMRAQLQKQASSNQDFAAKKKELEAEMLKGRENFGKVNKGLKNHEIVEMEMAEVEPSQSHAPLSPQKSKHSRISPGGHGMRTLKVKSSFDKDDSASTSMAAETIMPSGLRVSDWCFHGNLDSTPPIVKGNDIYENVRLLGRGSFGDVYLVKNLDDNKLFANKTIFAEREKDMVEVLREVCFLRTNRHPCIIDIHDGFISSQPRILNIITSYCESGDLGLIINNARKNRTNLSEAQILKWILQIGLALHFLHENGVIHRDLKPNNVMLTEGGDLVKVVDFGLAVDATKDVEANGEAGTPCYTAPEMIQGTGYSFSADCFSFGIMLHELMRLDLPFSGNNTNDLVRSILQDEPPAVPTHYSDELRLICLALLNKDSKKRLGFAGMLLYPLLSSKASSFPSSYRPKALEERVRRSHSRQLAAQLELLPSSKRSSLSPLLDCLPEHVKIAMEATEQGALLLQRIAVGKSKRDLKMISGESLGTITDDEGVSGSQLAESYHNGTVLNGNTVVEEDEEELQDGSVSKQEKEYADEADAEAMTGDTLPKLGCASKDELSSTITIASSSSSALEVTPHLPPISSSSHRLSPAATVADTQEDTGATTTTNTTTTTTTLATTNTTLPPLA